MRFRFFRKEHITCMFDPETFKIYLRQGEYWVETQDQGLRERIRLGAVELTRKEALGRSAPRWAE
jgi:hypothetical protein